MADTSPAEPRLTDLSAGRSDRDLGRIIVQNEFATVSVQLRDPGGRPRLLIEDLRTRKTIELDAIELESLAWARHSDLSPLLDPSRTRWASAGDQPTEHSPIRGEAR